jgi:protein-S-isoprenylcysteine O-methyltransferase Ste14
MNALELKIPPMVAGTMICAAMWGLSLITPFIQLPTSVRVYMAITIASFGGVLGMAGGIQFRQVKTTVNPIKPQTTSALVTEGIYKFTRNPMYLGFLFVIVAWAVFLSSPWALLGPCVYVLYLTRFQIIPEERVLANLFGAEYSAYKSRVRRWL